MTVHGVAMLTIGQQHQQQQVVLFVLSQHSCMERVAMFATLLHVPHAYPSVMKLTDCALAPNRMSKMPEYYSTSACDLSCFHDMLAAASNPVCASF